MLHGDQRSRLTRIWTPTSVATSSSSDPVGAHALLLRAGFLRQAYAGIFHLLPLGVRVQEKLERLVDKHMKRLGASKLSLSTISSPALWEASGRLTKDNTELFRFNDRKNADFLLSPTHEEEITSLVAGISQSYKDFPLRLYQITRKYRDELRPRRGLLRTKEFVMKDLYTFDHSLERAVETYHDVRRGYADFFDEFKLPYLVAVADSGNMGGNLSHEYHFLTARGEDHLMACDTCAYVANEELAETRIPGSEDGSNELNWDVRDILREAAEPAATPDEQSLASSNGATAGQVSLWRGISHDRSTLINAFFPSRVPSRGNSHQPSTFNTHAVKAAVPSLDAGIEEPLKAWVQAVSHSDRKQKSQAQIINVFDRRLPIEKMTRSVEDHPRVASGPVKIAATFKVTAHPITGAPLNLLRIQDGDPCPQCSTGRLKVHKAVELGHTFLLGTRYSEPLKASAIVPAATGKESDSGDGAGDARVALQMGCHGIGISRMIGAVADVLADEKGLNWPRVIAPFEVVVIPGKGSEDAATVIYDIITAFRALPSSEDGSEQHAEPPESIDAILDDRPREMSWKLKDADLVGYPVIVVLGRAWKARRMCEVQCRRLDVKADVAVEDLPSFVSELLAQL
ncbi:MAG: hypothetical protein M1817_006926 [Caeruleum heppii]|nr:MAG: hypothetical protein M1817_006926 [Caeruleum heppii]